jgi:hypothetical protein
MSCQERQARGGEHTPATVRDDKVQRGDVEEIDAAIWFSDLRGFTPLGEVRKFIGDAILAVWPVSAERPREATCKLALTAALAANDELASTARARVRTWLRWTTASGLHIGAAQYGNIGAEGRWDFTVIGPAVNPTVQRHAPLRPRPTRTAPTSSSQPQGSDHTPGKYSTHDLDDQSTRHARAARGATNLSRCSALLPL